MAGEGNGILADGRTDRRSNPSLRQSCDKESEKDVISFQSMSSCNISTVNALNECNLFFEIRERGKGKNKRHWVIEMNDRRRLYLSTYFKINLINHLIKNAALYYRTWKYWHLPKNTGTALAVCVVYDMYLECVII